MSDADAGVDVDVAIVGAGIAGAALAAQLAPHARVLLLERESQPGMHATGRSAAMFMPGYGSPQGRALTRASRAFYAAPPPGFADAPILSPRGVLYVGWRGDEARLDALEAELRAGGTAVERLGPAATLARLPVLRPDGLAGALAEPEAMDLDVHSLLQGWLRMARAAGALRWSDAALLGATREPGPGRAGGSGRWRIEVAGARRVRAELLVDAAGAWADEVAAAAGAPPIGVQPKRRSAFSFDAPPGIDPRRWPTTCAIDESWYFKPDAGQLLGSPANADPVPPHDVQPEEIDIATGIAGIEAATTLAIRRPRHTWAGLRTFAPDGEMLIGFDPACAGLFWLAGQGGWGIQSADAAARLAAALLLGTPLPDALRRDGVDAAVVSPARLRPRAR
jgi:D-arginine dehydrogenase